MKAARGRLAALNTQGRARRGALVCVLSTAAVAIALIAAPAASAWETQCATGPAAIRENSVFIVNRAQTTTRLNGNVQAGDLIRVTFTNTNPVSENCAPVTVTFAAYTAPDTKWDPNRATDQNLVESPSTSVGSGAQGQLSVTAPAPCFQVDLVTGAAINQLNPAIGQTYSQQHRLIDWANGGTAMCLPPP